MRIFGQQHGAVGPSGLRSGPIRTIRKGGRWARRAVAALAAVSAGTLLLTASAGTAPTFAASSPTPVIAARTIPAPKQAPNPRNITARVASTCATAAYKAGFPLDSFTRTQIGNYRTLVVAVAIGMAESGCNPGAVNGSGSCASRGVWQIEQCYWPRVTESCLQNAQCNGDAAWAYVYRDGNTFCWWQTFDPSCGSGYNGAWTSYTSAAEGGMGHLEVTLRNAGTGRCVAADASQAVNGGAVWQYDCSQAGRYAEWYVQQGQSNLNPVLQNVGTGLCLDAKGGQAQDHGKIIQWRCNRTTDPHQRWGVAGNVRISSSDVAQLTLRNSTAGNGTCLAADAHEAQNRGLIFQWICSGYSTNRYLDWN
jgi:Lysozyme like domain/Ricin-type beta-trefoil lectin domain-like